jgi:hypothetical protein
MGRPFTRKTSTERFIEKIKVDPNTGCWIWQGSMFGSVKTHQYGQFNPEGRNTTAHIWAYKRFIGEIPDGQKCCHRCDNTKCANPYHLFIGSQKDNIEDAGLKGKMGKKLTKEDVWDIRRLHSNGEMMSYIATWYKVDFTTVKRIVKRKTWKSI